MEKVLSVINDCVGKGLLWELTVLDLNEKLEYVQPFLVPLTTDSLSRV